MSESSEQRQFSTGVGEIRAATTVVEEEAANIEFGNALSMLQEGIEGYGDRIHAGAAVLRATDDLDSETDLLTHPRIEQAIWRYNHEPDRIRRQIEVTIERADTETTVDEIVAAFRIAASRIDSPIDTD